MADYETSIEDSINTSMIGTEQEKYIEQLRKNLHTLSEMNQKLEKKNQKLKKENEKLQLFKQEQCQKNENLAEMNKYLQERENVLQMELKEQKNALESLQQEKIQFDALAEKSAFHMDDFSRIEREQKENQEKISAIIKQNQTIKQRINDLAKENKKISQEVGNSEKKVIQLQNTLKEKNAELQSLKSQNIENINPEQTQEPSKKEKIILKMPELLDIIKQFLNNLSGKKLVKAKNIIDLYVEQLLNERS